MKKIYQYNDKKKGEKMTIFGIDLGTSNSVISFWDGKQTQVIPNQHGDLLTPSIVSIDETGEVLVGKIAKERLLTHPSQTAATFKRFMGTNKKYQLGDQQFTPIELSSLVLKSLKISAEKYLNGPCTRAVISVPAYFNNIQREATIEAAKLAGIAVDSLISEPTAAAVAYGLSQKSQMILVLDLGGGTFDVSLLDLFEGIIQVEATAGDNYLGGEEFTQVLVQDFCVKNGLGINNLQAQELRKVYQYMEHAKHQLGQDLKVDFSISLADIEYPYRLTVQAYEKLLETLLYRLKLPITRVLKDASICLTDIDHVILVGGATKPSFIHRYFVKLLKAFPDSHLNPDEVVAQGAAIHGELKQETFKEELILTDVSAYSLGVDSAVETERGFTTDVFVPIIERNSTIPVSKMNYFYTVEDNQKEMTFTIYQGENAKASENLKIGEVTIPLPKATKKGHPIACRFTYDTNGVVEVILEDMQNKQSQRLIIEENPGQLTTKEINDSLQKLDKLKILPENQAENRLLIARLERLYNEYLGYKREQIQVLLIRFRDVLQTQDRQLIQAQFREISTVINDLERDS
jgi:molecular chaperone HscC